MPKKIIKFNIACILVLLCSCVFVLLGCYKRQIKNLNSKGKNIICFGDSITFGYGANPGDDYPSILSKMLMSEVINAGSVGDTSLEALKRLEQDVLTKDPLLVLIEFGGNDFISKLPLEVTINNTREMTERIQSRGAMVAIVDISAGLFLKDYRSALSRVAKEKDAIFIPGVLSEIITNPSMKSDFFHPNAAGYKIIAKRIYRGIKPYLKQNTSLK
jgi:acyl-CoA thioesterase-1